jgi:hypothetical protein
VHLDTIKVYYSPTNAQVIVLKRILKFTGGSNKSLARPGRKQATATEVFDFDISYL